VGKAYPDRDHQPEISIRGLSRRKVKEYKKTTGERLGGSRECAEDGGDENKRRRAKVGKLGSIQFLSRVCASPRDGIPTGGSRRMPSI